LIDFFFVCFFYQFCQENSCEHFKHSKCELIRRTDVFQCKCPESIDVENERTEIISGHKTVYENCKLKDLCKQNDHKCLDSEADCQNILHTDSSGNSISDVLCTCDNGIRLASRTNFCSSCEDCNFEHTLNCDHSGCVCSDGFFGEKCDKKK